MLFALSCLASRCIPVKVSSPRRDGVCVLSKHYPRLLNKMNHSKFFQRSSSHDLESQMSEIEGRPGNPRAMMDLGHMTSDDEARDETIAEKKTFSSECAST